MALFSELRGNLAETARQVFGGGEIVAGVSITPEVGLVNSTTDTVHEFMLDVAKELGFTPLAESIYDFNHAVGISNISEPGPNNGSDLVQDVFIAPQMLIGGEETDYLDKVAFDAGNALDAAENVVDVLFNWDIVA